MVFFFLWLTSLSMIISRSIYVAANGMISFFFMAFLWLIFHYMWWPHPQLYIPQPQRNHPTLKDRGDV